MSLVSGTKYIKYEFFMNNLEICYKFVYEGIYNI
jgi:hypothetical protein